MTIAISDSMRLESFCNLLAKRRTLTAAATKASTGFCLRGLSKGFRGDSALVRQLKSTKPISDAEPAHYCAIHLRSKSVIPGPRRLSIRQSMIRQSMITLRINGETRAVDAQGFPHGMPTTEADTINTDLLAFIEG